MAQAFMDVSQNPANISKYQNNPKVQKIIQKMSEKFGMPGGGDGAGDDMPPGPPGGAPGGGAGGAGATQSQPDLGVD